MLVSASSGNYVLSTSYIHEDFLIVYCLIWEHRNDHATWLNFNSSDVTKNPMRGGSISCTLVPCPFDTEVHLQTYHRQNYCLIHYTCRRWSFHKINIYDDGAKSWNDFPTFLRAHFEYQSHSRFMAISLCSCTYLHLFFLHSTSR